MGTRWTRTWIAGLAVLGVAGSAIAPAPVAAAVPGASPGAALEVIVDGASSDDVVAAVVAAGGTVSARLELIGAVVATVPASAVAQLEAAGLLVVADRSVAPVDHHIAAVGADALVQITAMNPGAAGGATAGQGVGVAIIDTGVSPHADLPTLRAGVDLSGAVGGVRGAEATRPADGALVDGYGHGTFIAGLVAGQRTGVAPGAEVVSIKVAGDDGETDLGTLIAGIGWAVVNQDQAGIDVLNLSFGAISPVPAQADPLVQAVEAAWASGLTVVTASGNEGAGTVTSPGTSPSALTIGGTDTSGTATLDDDVVAAWSGSIGGRTPKPELVAPGTSVVSLRAPGSTVDLANPDNAVAGGHGPGYFVGSGTSMATGLAAGAAAVVIAHHPEATPGDVKSALIDTARPAGGAATIDLEAAALTEVAAAEPAGNGKGKGVGPKDTGGKGEVAAGWSGARWTGARWTGARWTGARWTGARWTEAEWAGARWTGARWTGARWTGARWTGARWTGAIWTGADLG